MVKSSPGWAEEAFFYSLNRHYAPRYPRGMRFNMVTVAGFGLIWLSLTATQVSADMLTYHNDLARTGAVLDETVLNTSNVNQTSFGKLFNRPVDDEVYSQILYKTGVSVPGRGTHNVIYVATVNNTVYAYDADYPDESTPLWVKNYNPPGGRAVTHGDLSMGGACGGNYNDFSGNIGIVGTPVIDPTPFPGAGAADQGTIYFVTRTNTGGVFDQYFHAVNLRDGSERPNSPVLIQGAVLGTGSGNIDGVVPFNPFTENQRPGLALVQGVVYISWASHCDLGPYHGWLIGYHANSLAQEVVYNLTPDGVNGGIWMGGQAPSADENGNIYINSGNGTIGTAGDVQGTRNRSMSFAKLTRSGGTMSISTFFTPYNYPTLESGDVDLGSTGLLLVPETTPKIAIGAGKQGRMYVVLRDNMGGYNSGGSSDPNVVQSIDVKLNNKIMGSPVYWKGPGGTQRIYVWCANDNLKAYTYNPGAGKLNLPPATSTVTTANPGAMLSITASGTTAGTGILWAMCPTANANQQVVPGYLRAFNAENLGQELWNSQMNSARDDFGNYAKFNPPTVIKGKVYLPTFSKQVVIYGLITAPIIPTTPTDLVAVAISKTQLHLAWTDQSSNESGFRIERSVENGPYELLNTVQADISSYDDTTADPFVHYAYRVRGFTSNGSSAFSNIALAFTDTGNPEPEIAILGNSIVIPSGSMVANQADGSDFGPVVLPGGATISHTFTIRNSGNAPLSLNGIPTASLSGAGAASFQIITLPASSVAGGQTTNFEIRFSPASGGIKDATVSISNNDSSESTYTFSIRGSGLLQDLAAWMKFNETSGSIAIDSSGNDNNGSLVGPPLPVRSVVGRLGGAMAFNGSVNQSVAIPSSSSLNPTLAMSVTAWIYPNQWGNNANRRILQKGSSDNQYRLCAENNVLKWDIANVGTVTTTLPATAAWTHVAATYDGTNMRLFINGTQAGSVGATVAIPTTNDALQISTKNPNSTANDHFDGLLDDVRIYDRALSNGEISSFAAQTGTVAIVATDSVAQKASGDFGLFTFTRTGSTANALNVNFNLLTGPDQGVYRTDFGLTPLPPVLSIPAGQASATLSVNPLYLDQPTGTLDVTVTVNEGAGYAVADHSQAIVQLLDSPLNQWKIKEFGSLAVAQSPIANDDADFDQDGYSTLFEFAFGLNPTIPDVPQTAVVAMENITGNSYLTFTFRRPSSKPVGITYLPEVSTGLQSESWGDVLPVAGYPLVNGDGTETMKYRSVFPVTASPTGFGRMRVTRP